MPPISADGTKFERQADTKKIHCPAASIVIICLIFFSIIPYAGADVWSEAVVLATIFTLGCAAVFRRNFALVRELKLLLAPILILAFYSFIQGSATLLERSQNLPVSAALPYSFDLMASFWSALKFLALAVFIKVLLIEFRHHIKLLVWSLVFTGNFFAVLGIFRFLIQASFPEQLGQFIFPELQPNIGFGTFFNQNHYAFLMLMNFGLNLGLFAYGGLEKNKRLPLFVFCLITWMATVLTGSRGGIISSFVEIAVLILLPLTGVLKSNLTSGESYPSKIFSIGKKLAIFAVITFALIVGIALIGQDRVISRFEEIPSQLEGTTNSATFRRTDVWKAALLMIDEHRFYGVGFGGFGVAVSQYIDISGALVPQQAHNDYLEFVACGGAVSTMCGILFLYQFFSTLCKRFWESTESFDAAARFGVVCGIAGIAVHSLFDFGAQLIGNWLFLAAFISIAAGRNSANEKEGTGGQDEFRTKGNSVLVNLFRAACFVGLITISLLFGAERLRLYLAETKNDASFLPKGLFEIPFDADSYKTKALIESSLGDATTAAQNMEKAVNLQPENYNLWIRFGEIQQTLKRWKSAENCFRQAIALAPRYGEPHFYLGSFLVETDQRADGFKELNFAFHRNPQYFERVLALVWRETNENTEETIKLLSPLDVAEKDKLAAFLFEKNAYGAIVGLVCHEKDLPPVHRDNLIVKLLEKRQFFYARQIYGRNCNLFNDKEVNLDDGDFETGELQGKLGFGWRIGDLPETVEVGFDQKTFFSRNASLEFLFSGNSESSLPLLSQIITIEKNHRHNLSFAYRTKEMVSGGLPVLQLILKQPEADVIVREIKLSANESGWIKSQAAIETGGKAEALEIRLTRQSCRELPCPIFGRLWLDDFVLK